jgi:probable HAF family extracellular repeat protein
MKRVFILLLVIVFSAVLIQGCGGDGSSASPKLQDPGEDDPGGTPPPVIGELGDLIDLGDLVYPLGDHWYFTWARVINDEGTVVGQSNRGSPHKGAFKWESETMTFLGIHSEPIFSCSTEPPAFVSSTFSEAVDINETGVIIGNSTTSIDWPNEEDKRAFLWENDVFTDLHPPGPIWSEAVDINNKGEVIVTLTYDLSICNLVSQANYWDGETLTGSVPDYKPLSCWIYEGSSPRCKAVAINENGQLIINSGIDDEPGTVTFYDVNWDVYELLDGLPGATITVAVDINDSGYVNNDAIPDGHVIGSSGNGFDREELKRILSYPFKMLPEEGGPTIQGMFGSVGEGADIQGFFWDGGAMYPVDHLGGGKSIAADINDKDQVVGGALTADGKTHAFLWTLGSDEKGVITDLGTLGGDNSFALAINEAGQVVGWAETGESYSEQGVVRPVRHAFLWEDGQMYDLGVHNDFYDYSFIPPYPFSYAVDINELGVLNALTGNSITINEHSRGFFLGPEMP